MTGRRLCLPVLLAVCIAAGCGGGGGDESSATAWADDLCSAITGWTESVQETSDSLKEGNLSEDSLRTAADDFRSATEEFVDDIRGLGPPDTEAGDEVEAAVEELADSVDENRAELEDAVEGDGSLSETVAAVTGALAAMGQQLAATFRSFEETDAGEELETAFRDADSCDELETSGS